VPLVITPVYAAVLAAIFIFLSLRVIAFRRGNRVSLGDGGHAVLANRIRAHANFNEYVPFTLLLMLMAELGGTAAVWLHLTGLLLVAGRVLHAVHLLALTGNYTLRTVGMTMTFIAMSLAALIALPL
jgi:uncharacterized protein